MSETIALGGSRFELRPLKLGQLRHVLDALDDMAGKSGGGLIAAAATLVAAGLQPAYPAMAAETVLDLEAGIDELNAAVGAILRVAGLRPRETVPGEAPAPDGPPPGAAVPGMASPGPVCAASSAPSTAPSPPAAAIRAGSSTA
jgi:hypothetical protein